MTPRPTTATPDVVVVGAGILGASCAVHLARAGCRVTLVDRAAGPGAGSTARATGGFRAQFATAIDIRLSLLARDRLLAFADDTGVDPEFVQVGYLWLAATREQLAQLVAANELQHREGLHEARIVGLDEIRDIQPHAALDGVAGGAWCPSDGVLRPMELLRGYLELAERLGVAARWDEDVVAFERAGDRIRRVVTTRSSYTPDIVVDAAGPWAAEVGKLAGIELPVAPLRRQVAITTPTTALPATMPLTIWLDDGFHARVRDGRVLLLRPTPGDPSDPWNVAVDEAWLDDIASRAAARFPALRDVPLDRARAWAGLYEMTPDHHALVGFTTAVCNLLLVTGASGHGVMHAPALGLLAAEIATLGRATTLDISALRPSRFDDNDPVRGATLL